MANEIRTFDTTIAVWEDRVDESDMKRRIFEPLIRFLRSRGWKVGKDTTCHYRSLRPSRRLAEKGELQAHLELTGRVVTLNLWQDVYKVENPNGGRYDHGKRARMPYLLGKRCDLEIGKVLAFFVERTGYAVANANRITNDADAAIKAHLESSGHYKPELGHAEMHATYNTTSGDGVQLRHGQTVWTRDFKGRCLRATAFYNLNNMWWVRFNRHSYTNLSCGYLLTKPPANPREKKNADLRRGVLERLLAHSVEMLNFTRAELFRKLLFGDQPLFRIHVKPDQQKGRGAYYGPLSSGYTSNPVRAGLYTGEEAGKIVVGSATDRIEAVAVAGCANGS